MEKSRGDPGDRTATCERGQSLVEFAFALPVFLFVILVSFQLPLIAMQSYSTRHLTRDTARCLAINPDTIDSALVTRVQLNIMTAMHADGFLSVVPSPPCPTLTGGHCSGRAPGDVITVAIVYDVSRNLFLPTTFGLGGLQISLPTALPPYRVSVLIE